MNIKKSLFVNVLPLPQPNFEFPNVITPNSDGTNDIFEIQNLIINLFLNFFDQMPKYTYLQMITDAILKLSDRKGASRQAIWKYIKEFP